MRSKLFRFALWGSACSLLGLATAWGVAIRAANPDLPPFDDGLGPPTVWRTSIGSARVQVVLGHCFDRSESSIRAVHDDSDRDGPPIAAVSGLLRDSGLPSWTTELARYGDLSSGSLMNIETYGWPFRCFVSAVAYSQKHEGPRWRMGRDGDYSARVGKALGWRVPGGFDRIVVPYVPIVDGLVVNSIVYGAGWAVLLSGGSSLIFRLVRGARRRRGRCPACSYDLRADFDGGCPECGWNRSMGPSAMVPRSTDGPRLVLNTGRAGLFGCKRFHPLTESTPDNGTPCAREYRLNAPRVEPYSRPPPRMERHGRPERCA